MDIRVEDAASVRPHGSEGVRVAFTLACDGVNRLDGLTDSALVDLLGAGGDEPGRIASVTRPRGTSIRHAVRRGAEHEFPGDRVQAHAG